MHIAPPSTDGICRTYARQFTLKVAVFLYSDAPLQTKLDRNG